MTIQEQTLFQIKGQRDGLLISIREGDWQLVLQGIIEHIRERVSFFKGAKVAVDVGARQMTVSEISSLRDQLSDFNIILWALYTTDDHTRDSARNLGLETKLPQQSSEAKSIPFDTQLSGDDAIFVRRTLRSGYRVVHHGHVVLVGDLNPGAEIIAGGSVIVWGRLRGVVHAGAEGDEDAIICALDLSPTQIRIASVVSVAPGKKGKPQPEVVSIQQGQLIAKPWK